MSELSKEEIARIRPDENPLLDVATAARWAVFQRIRSTQSLEDPVTVDPLLAKLEKP